jgi:hypothetical protein
VPTFNGTAAANYPAQVTAALATNAASTTDNSQTVAAAGAGENTPGDSDNEW